MAETRKRSKKLTDPEAFRGDSETNITRAEGEYPVTDAEASHTIAREMSRIARDNKSEVRSMLHNEKRSARMPSLIDPSDWNLDESQEPYCMHAGEHKLRIVAAEIKTDKNANNYIALRFEFPSEPYAKEIYHNLQLPNAKMGQKQLNNARFNMQMFVKAFDIDLDRHFDPAEEWPAHEGYALITLTDSDEFGEQNRIKKFIAGN